MPTVRTAFAAALAACVLWSPALAQSGAGASAPSSCAVLPASGQRSGMPADRNDGKPGPVPVAADGNVRAGAPMSFTDNGDGTVTDNNTGLVWEKKSNDGGLHDKDNVYRWSGDGAQETVWDWLDKINAEGGAGFAGHSDWRVPNIKELQSIREYEDDATAPAPLVTKGSYYWSSTTVAQFTNAAWTVFFAGGGDMVFKDKASHAFYVRAVRGPARGGGACPQKFPATGQKVSYKADKNDGVPGPVSVPDDGALQVGAPLSYTDNGDGTVTDNNTGLVWESKTDDGGLHDKDDVYRWSGDGAQDTIWDWLDKVNAEGGAGFARRNDWRIPNVKEFIGLIDYGRIEPAIDPAFAARCGAGKDGRCTVPSKYWSSTGPIFVQFGVGYAVWEGPQSLYFARAVRGGQTSPAGPSERPRSAGAYAAPPARPPQPPIPAAAGCPAGKTCARLSTSGMAVSFAADKNDGVEGAVPVPDDGAVQAGLPLSFTDNGDGTITDNNTGLIWEKKSDDGGLHDKDNMYRWSGDGSQDTIWDWLDKINAEKFGGHADWRIPNVRELTSIANFGRRAPAVEAAFHRGCAAGSSVQTGSCTPASWVFSSTTMDGWPNGAWMVSHGGVGHVFWGDKVQPLAVRAVRGPVSAPRAPLSASGQTKSYPANKNDGKPRAVAVPDDGAVRAGAPLKFVDNRDGTVTDAVTGLMWENKRDGGGLHDKDNLYAWSGNGDEETIWDWLADVNAEGGSGFAGHHDWRVPNLREMLSIIDYGRSRPALDPAFISNPSSHRTGTALRSNMSWHVGADFGWISREVINLPLSIRAVRNADAVGP